MAQAPPANVVTSDERSGSPARSRGTCHLAPGPPAGSTTRNEITASPGSSANRYATYRASPVSGYQPSSSRNMITSPAAAATPALRPPPTPRLAGSATTFTPSGATSAGPPLTTSTTSRLASRCARALAMARATSAGRSPIVNITQDSFTAPPRPARAGPAGSPEPPGGHDGGQVRHHQERGDDQARDRQHAGGEQPAADRVRHR